MKITVCETSDDNFWNDWLKIAKNSGNIVLLPELPAYPWFAKYSKFDRRIWNEALEAHDRLIAKLEEIDFAVVSTRPVQTTKRLNQAFLWDGEYIPIRSKYYMPNEWGFYEKRWFDKGNSKAEVIEWNGIRLGVLICSEVFFQELAREYAKLGVHVIFVPRATQAIKRWLTALKMTAIVSGAFVASSNRYGNGFSGRGWIISPDGDVLASTSQKRKFVSVDVDIEEAERAKSTYPRTLY